MGSQCCKCQSSNKPTSSSSTSSYFGEPLRRGEQELVGDRYRVSENNNTVLLNLHSVTRDDAGHYTLTAKNSAGEARRAIEIKVEGAGSDVPVFLRRLSDLAVKVGTRTRFLVEIRCASDVTVSWHRNNEHLLEGERFHFVHEGNFFCVDVAPVMMEDGGRWTCMAEGAGGRTSCSSHLNVLVPKAYKAPEFLEELQALLTEQGTVSLECKVVGVPTPVLRWYKDGQEIKAGDVFALTANPDDPTSLGTYTCEAVNCMGKAYSSSRVHVVGKGSREGSLRPADSMKPVGPAPVFKQNLRDEKIKIGDTLTLTCQVCVPPWPQSIAWYNKEGRAEDSDRYHIMADGLGGYMIQISNAEAADEGEWKCVATSSLGARGISTCHVSMTYPKNYRKPRFLETLKAVLTDEGLVSFECKVVGFPAPQLRWFKDGEELKPGDVYQLTGTNSLGSYCCIAKNCMGQATSSAELTLEDIQNQLNEEERLQLFSTNQPPKFIVGLKSCEAKITEDFRFTVQVTISPEPSISWYRDDEQVDGTERYRVSREALGTCHLDISSLEIVDQAEWKCVATNEFGHSVTSCFLKLVIPRHFKKPRFLESLRAILSEEGAVNLECKVIGVPQPVLKWYKDGEELKPGDIHRIISGQDGTCCLGTYTCEARNCMGTVASSASLLGFEERLMKAATQHKVEHAPGHILARNPSLSTIHEERTSQMYDTPATERTSTADERAEVSFSFDGKEVSVSLYETPDLTEEEALQVVEMYADQLSEHVSEHNVVELPPLRFVKETSNTGRLLMEAIVIDVTHDAFASSAEDDLRTDADLEEFSITDDNGQQAPPLPQDEDALLEKLDAEFLERALAPTVPYDVCEEAVAPKRPPRRKTDSSQRAKPDGESKGSDTSAKGGVTPKDDEDRSEHFTDAVAYISEKDSYASARGSSGDAKAYKVASVEERRIGEPQSTKSSPPELVRNTELCTEGKDGESRGAEVEQQVAHKQAENAELSSQPGSLKKKMRSVESGLGRSFEESTEERTAGEPPGPKPERPARKGSKSRNERSIESGQGGSFEESGDDRTSSETSITAPKLERRHSQKKAASADVGSIETYMKKIQEQQNVLRRDSGEGEDEGEGKGMQVAEAKEVKRSTTKESRVSTEVQTDGSIVKKELELQQPLSMDVRDSGDTEETAGTAGKQGHLSSSSVDLPTLKAAEQVKSAAEKGQSSLLESLTRSLQDIQEGLASVEKQVQEQSTSEPGHEHLSLSLLEAPTQPTERSVDLGEEKGALGAPCEENVSCKVLENIRQPVQEFHGSLASVEQQLDVERREECMLEKTSVSLLENVAPPVQDLQRDTAAILQFAERTHEDISETREEELPEIYMQSSLKTISQSIHELQRGIAVLRQHIAYEDAGETASHVDISSILATLSHPLHELRRGLAEVQQQALLEAEEAYVGQSIMETFARPIQELQTGLEALEQQTFMEMGATPITETPSKTALQLLASPIDALQTGLSQIGQSFLIDTKPPKTLPRDMCVLESLQKTLQSLQHAVEIVPNISTLQETASTVIVHEVGELRAVTLLAEPLAEIQLCLNILEISEFKSRGQPVLATEERDTRLDMLMEPLAGLHSRLTQIEERITAGATKNLTSQSARVVTVQSLLQPIRNLKTNIAFMRGIASSEYTVRSFNLLESLEKPLKEFTESLVKIEQEAILNVTPKQTANLKSLSTAKAVVNCIEILQEAIVKINEQHTLEDQEELEIKVMSKLECLAQPLFQIKQSLVGAVQNVMLDESKEAVPESTPGNTLASIVRPLEVMQKELFVIERDLITKKETDPATKKSAETLLRPVKDLQESITAIARQASEAAPGTSGLSALESLLQPLQGLQMAIAVVAPKESSLLLLDSMKESFEALLRGVAAAEKQVLAEAMQDPRRLSVTRLGALTEPLKELQKEINLVEQKIQFESEEELASESSGIYALSGLVQPLQELQRALLLIEHFALQHDVKPLVHKAAGVLVEPILELQRGISAINQKATRHADAVEIKGFTILETLAQPLQGLQRALSVVEEQNIMILEEALIFEKASSLAAVEKVTQSLQELHRRISTIEHCFSLLSDAKRNEFAGLSDLHKIAKPLMEIHERLVQVEDHIFEAGDKPKSERTFILCLEATAKPMQDLTTELSQVEQALMREPDSRFDQDEPGRSNLPNLARPINALQGSVEVIQRLAAQETETAPVFQTLAQPLQDLQDGLAFLKGYTAVETSVERPTQKSSVNALHTLATSIEEIHSGIVHMQERAGSESLEHTVSEEDAASFLEAVAHPLKELQQNLGQVQHQILLEKTAEYPNDTFLLTFAIPVWELQRGLALIEQNALLESSEKPLTAVSMVQAIAQPVQEIYTALAQIQEQVLLEAPETPIIDRSDISILKTLANPIHELQKSLAVLEHQVALEPNEEQLSDKPGTSVLETVAQPLEELHKNLVLVEQHVLLEVGERSISEEAGLSVLETLAHPIQDLERGIAFIQHQVALEAREVEMSDKTAVSVLKTLAQPLQELQRGLLQIEEQLVMEVREEPLSEKAELSLLKTLAQPIAEIQKSIAVIEQQVIFEASVQPLPKGTGISVLKELATPLYELQQNLAQVEQQVALEAKDEFLPELSLSVFKAVAQPIHEIQRTIALIQQQDILEAGGEMSNRTSITLLQTLAQPLEELEKGIAEIQEQIALEAAEETISENSAFSVLQGLAEPIQEICRGIAVIQECATYEGGVETLSEKTNVSALQALAQPIQELLERIAVFQQQAPVEHCEALSENEDVSALMKLAQPVEELQRTLLQVEQQVALEAHAGDIQMQSVPLLRKLAQPILELQTSIALIEKQAVLECAECLSTDTRNLSLLRELAVPLQELQKGIVMIEQQQLLEGPLSDDATNISDLRTFVSSAEASQVLGAILVEEQRALESETDTLTEMTDARELESTAVSQQEPKRSVAIVQEQTALEGNISKLATETYEVHVAHLSHEMERETATVEEPEVVKEEIRSESIENISKEADIETEVMECKDMQQEETEIRKAEEKEIVSSKVSEAEGSNERGEKYETNNKEYGERECSNEITDDECNRRQPGEFELGQEKAACTTNEKDQGLDEKNDKEELQVRMKEEKKVDHKEKDVEGCENFNKERKDDALKEKLQKGDGKTEEQDEAEGNVSEGFECKKNVDEGSKTSEKETEVADEREEARCKRNDMAIAEIKEITEESEKQLERTERKTEDVDKHERTEKELKEAGFGKKDKEKDQSQKVEQEDRELTKGEKEERERKKKEEEKAERKDKEHKEEEERKRKEQEEVKRNKKELEERKADEKIKEKDGGKGKEKQETEYTKKDSEGPKTSKKETEVAESNNEREEARHKENEITTAKNEKGTEKEQLEKAERKTGEVDKDERTENELKDAGLNKKDQEEARSQNMKEEEEERDRQKKEEEEAERKNKEDKEAEVKRKEQEEVKRKKQELEERKADEKIKEKDEAKGKEKEETEYTREESEGPKTSEKETEVADEQKEAGRKKNEMVTAENKKVTEDSSDRKQLERSERKADELDKDERKEKELKEAGLDKKDQEKPQSQKVEQKDSELAKGENEERERQKKEEEEAERKNKEHKEAEVKRKEQEEVKRKKNELEEHASIEKLVEKPELETVEDGTEVNRSEKVEAEHERMVQEKAEHKEKELAESELEQTCAGSKTKKEEYKSRAERKRKTHGKMKDREEGKQDKILEEDLKSDVSRKIKEQVEPENKEDENESVKSRHAMEVVDSARGHRVEREGVICEVTGTKDDAESWNRVVTSPDRNRNRQDTGDTEKENARSRTHSVQNDNKVEWVAEGTVQKTRSFDDRQWAEERAVVRQRQFDDSLDSSDTVTYSSSSSTLTPTSQQHTLGRTEGTRRIVVKEKVESGPRDARKKPTFATRLTDRTAAQGSRIKLTCSVLGSPEPVVEWLRDGLPLVGEHHFKTRCEDGLASLEVLNASPGDSGEFTCVARNLHGETSSTATLRVFAGFEPAPSPPTFTRAIKDSYRFSDDELILECRVRCHPPPKITWLKDGVPLQGSNRHQQSELADGICRLIISSPDATTDSGQYTCVAENNVWSDQISSAVQFAGRDSYATLRRSRATSRVSRDARRPHISNVLTDHAVPVGGTIALQVEVKGAPKLDVTWLRGNEPLHFLTPKMRTFEDSGVYSLVMTDVSEKEAGLYTCRASNAFGHVDTSATVGIVAPGSVRGGKPAMFVNRPDMDMAVAVGEDISVSFRVTGDPKPKVTWMKGIKDITNSQRSLKETLDDYVRLTLKRALVSDAGTYCILAKNVYGCDRAFFTVTIRQRARSLTPSLEWTSQTTADILRDVRDSIEISRMKDVPGPVAGEPVVVDSGRNWLTLSWPKSEVRGGAPVVAYRVEAWPLGGDGGARWIEMGISPTNTFDAFNLKAGTEYKFRVTPRNRYGWGESVTTTAAVAVGRKVELPEFTRILPGQLKALQGSSISLECEVRGDPVPRVQWYRDGMELDDPRFVARFDGSLTCRLTVQELRDGDSGRYMCEATNRVGRVSTFARLFVVNDPKILEADHKLKRGIQDDQEAGADMPPQFTMRLRDRRVQMTYPVRLTCQVAGCPAPEVTWSKNGDVIKEDDHHAFWSGGNFHTLEMSHTTLEDSGCYSATARNANGAVCCRCHLVVDKGIRAYVAPEFLFELDPEHCVREGGELRLSAQVEAYPTVGVMWHRDGVRLRPSRRTVMTLNHDGTVELALAGVSRRDAGVYSCTATNEVGRAETSTRVNVQVTEAPPTAELPAVIGPEIPFSKVPLFVTKPRSTEAVEGDTVIILCEVVGDPKPEVMWLRDWLKPDYYRDAPHFRRVGDGPQYRLEIPRAKLDFTGAYSVIARNCHGEAKAVISLQIYAKGQGKENGMDRSSVKHGKVQTLPVIKRELKDIRCCDGDAVTLECCVQATPAPDIRWEKGGRLLPLGGDFSAAFDGDTARLHIHQVYPEDEGEYTCVAYNELGRAVTSACLVVDVPEEKETLLSRQLSRPVGLLSAGSTPRSTPRTTPSRSKSPSEPRHRGRDGTPPRYIHGESGRHRLKAAAPKFYAVPHNRVAEEGETVRFQCAIAGHPTPWVSWDKDGVLVTPSARLTLSERDDLRILEISEVTVEDAGFYRITLENEVGRVEANARLEVIGHYGGRSRVVRAWSASPRTSPTFGRRLIGSAARVGGRLTLACDIRGSPTPASTWYRNGELVVRSSRVTPTWDGRTARLEIENLEMEDAGMYTCVAENEMGKTRCSARLIVLDKDDPSEEDRQPPVFLQNLPPEVAAVDGDMLELQVRLQGTPPLDVVWVKDGVEVPDCEDFRYVDRGDGHFGLRLADVFPQDSGMYSCEAYNEHGEAVTSGGLSVREGSTRVQFSKRPTPVLTSPGSTATFCARVHSCGPRPRVSWTVAGRPLDCCRHKVESEGDVHMLHIAPVELCDGGQVTCVARAGMSGDEECVARTELTVRDDDDMCDVGLCSPQSVDVAPAVLLRGPSDTTALRGDRVVLKATYVGVPQPVVRWLKAGHELSSGDRVAITTENGVTFLVIENITADDSGKYVVSVENGVGADCNFASVAVEGPADPPAGRPSVSCSGNTVTVAWCSAPYDGGCMVTGYCVEMRRMQDTEWQVVTNSCHSLSYVVPGLIPAEQYVFRVRAENIHGLSEASTESEPFQMGSDEESFMPAFEPRVVTLAPGEEFKANFEVLEELGKGRYGVVHKVVEHATGQKYAAKFIRCIKAKDREKVQEEIDIMNILRHPKLLQLAAAFESPREVVMVMEYISGGELFERVVADDFTLTERDCILFMRQICEGVDYMHQNYVVHLDLKPENVMCHTRTSHQIKLIDFGLAQKINPDTPVRVLFGTPEFIPPEIINYEPIGVESDMWSVGVICYVLLSGLSPFMGDNDAETFANITRADYDFDDEAFDAISQDAKDFISALLVKRKEKRMTARECLQHIWLAQHDEKMSCVRLCTDKLKKFIIRRKWQLNVMLKRQTA